MAKGPYKIILTATDFVFPQIPERRVSSQVYVSAIFIFWNNANQ